MKYKEKYIEAQKVLAATLSRKSEKFGDIYGIASHIEYSLDGRLSELSPELYEFLQDKLCEIRRICRENT